jgi:hypothetical protein
MTQSDDLSGGRPLYLNVVVWGAGHRADLLNFLLPSLLSARNIPALSRSRGNKFLFATTKEDWAVISQAPIFHELARHIEPVLQEIPWPEPGSVPLLHMGIGHILATELAFHDQAFLSLLTPDMVFSDGSFELVERYMREGTGILRVAALRFGQEPFLAKLVAFEPRLARIAKEGDVAPVALPARALVDMALDSMHSETLEYEWPTPYYISSSLNTPVAAFWRVPGGRGLVLHSMSWAPLLLDYKYVERHDVSTLRSWTIDGDYVFRNFPRSTPAKEIVLSDDLMMVSWGPMAVGRRPMRRRLTMSLPVLAEYFRCAFLRSGYYRSAMFDDMKRDLFWISVRWIGNGATAQTVWDRTDARAMRSLRRAIGDWKDPNLRCRSARLFASTIGFALWWERVAPMSYLEVLFRALVGDRDARARVWHRLRSIVLTGRYGPRE